MTELSLETLWSCKIPRWWSSHACHCFPLLPEGPYLCLNLHWDEYTNLFKNDWFTSCCVKHIFWHTEDVPQIFGVELDWHIRSMTDNHWFSSGKVPTNVGCETIWTRDIVLQLNHPVGFSRCRSSKLLDVNSILDYINMSCNKAIGLAFWSIFFVAPFGCSMYGKSVVILSPGQMTDSACWGAPGKEVKSNGRLSSLRVI